ncbi:MAG: ion transporter [Nanohaloarchaea archaeon]|nr:ion transporter [Candidatus Nanohaloarchaea archaeon]
MHRKTIKETVRFYLTDQTTKLGKAVDIFIIFLNLFTVGVFIVEAYLHDTNPAFFWNIEVATVSIFIFEYILRFWAANKKLKHITDIYSIIDIIAIIPTFITFIDLRFIRVFRVFRIFRFMRFINIGIFISKDAKMHDIRILRIIFTIISIIFIFSSFIYEVEVDANPDIETLGSAIYFSIVTLSTVGFGDIVPVTVAGKLMTVLMILVSIALIPWQLGLLIKEFIFADKKKRHITCKKCGLLQHDCDAIHCKHCGTIIYRENEGDD